MLETPENHSSEMEVSVATAIGTRIERMSARGPLYDYDNHRNHF